MWLTHDLTQPYREVYLSIDLQWTREHSSHMCSLKWFVEMLVRKKQARKKRRSEKMIPTPNSNSVDRAVAHFDRASPQTSPPSKPDRSNTNTAAESRDLSASRTPLSKRQRCDTDTASTSLPSKRPRLDTDAAPPLLVLPASATSGLGTLGRLAPEMRNAIYAMVFGIPVKLLVVAVEGPSRRFQLRERSDQAEHDTLSTLQALGKTSREMRREVHTYFYNAVHFVILPYDYEYLPMFVRWLEAIPTECLAVLHSVYFAGNMWCQPDISLTARFHESLRSSNLRDLRLQINIRHLCESCLPELDAYFTNDGPVPRISLEAWATTLKELPELKCFRLDLVMMADKERVRLGKEPDYRNYNDQRGRSLADKIKRKLKAELRATGARNGAPIQVRWLGGSSERTYRGDPW